MKALQIHVTLLVRLLKASEQRAHVRGLSRTDSTQEERNGHFPPLLKRVDYVNGTEPNTKFICP